MRLGILSALAVNEYLTFNDLKRLLQTTDGNLSVHARRLEEVNYIECSKSFEGRVPRTEYRLTIAGRTAFERYLDHMEALIQAMREHFRTTVPTPVASDRGVQCCACIVVNCSPL